MNFIYDVVLNFNKDYYNFFLAFDGNRHIGTVGFTRSFDEADVSNVCVDEEYRKEGIASFLLDNAIRTMIQNGVFHFTLEVREKNIPAIRLYEKQGFVNEGIRPNFYSNPKDNAVIMWKHIDL